MKNKDNMPLKSIYEKRKTKEDKMSGIRDWFIKNNLYDSNFSFFIDKVYYVHAITMIN